MNRREAEVIATAIRTYVETMVEVAKVEDPPPKVLLHARLAFERLEDALVGASRHG